MKLNCRLKELEITKKKPFKMYGKLNKRVYNY